MFNTSTAFPGQFGRGCSSGWLNEDYAAFVYRKIGVPDLLPNFEIWVCDYCPF